MNVYHIVFEGPGGQQYSGIGRANNIPYAIQSALRDMARRGVNVSGLKYRSHELVGRA